MSGRWMVAVMAAGLALGQGAGEIAGVLVEQQGQRPVGGVYVEWTKLGDTPWPGDAEKSGGLVTRADGTFAFAGLGAGTYILCAIPAPRTAWLAPCQWEPNPPRIVLKEGERRRSEKLQLAEGVRVEVGVTDVEGVVEKPEAPGKGKALAVTVAGKSRVHYPVVLLERTGAALRYSVVAPRNEVLKLRVEGMELEVEDDATKEKGGRLERELGTFAAGQAGPAKRSFTVRTAGKR